MENIKTLDDFIRSDYFAMYEESWCSNLVCSFWNNDIVDRIEKAAEFGSDGRTHQEVIDLWRDAVMDCERDDVIAESIRDSIIVEIDSCELWHENNGSLYEQLS